MSGFAANRTGGWATCSLTENGLVNILSNSVYTGVHETPAGIVQRLETFCESGGHIFWADEVSLLDSRLFRPAMPATYRQVTDIYLLGLAKRRGGMLATFDGRIPLTAVVGAGPDNLELIPA